LFERPQSGERALLVHLNLDAHFEPDAVEELGELATTAGAEVVGVVAGARHAPDPRYFVGTGKAEEIKLKAKELGAELVIVNHRLSPSQERNLEKLIECRVLDRVGLILDIFAQRARTHEGKLQVELAQLKHIATRLRGGWTHLSRQKSAIGMRGPGETQLETDRRLIKKRITVLGERLEKVQRQRDTGRQARERVPVPVVTLVGYTNAGKSTLFNRLTGSGVYAADKLFATLDPTVRRAAWPDASPLVLADTVGFIRHLPHDLVAAFRATLVEVREADLLLHVVDAADERRDEHLATVRGVLDEIGAGEVPVLLVHNKVDLTGQAPQARRDEQGQVAQVWVSAHTGAGLEDLQAALVERVCGDLVDEWIELEPAEARLRARLFERGAVKGEELTERGGWRLKIKLPRRELEAMTGGHTPLAAPAA
jgi:GTP-binding protein HflX